jgi:hypothetical protein
MSKRKYGAFAGPTTQRNMQYKRMRRGVRRTSPYRLGPPPRRGIGYYGRYNKPAMPPIEYKFKDFSLTHTFDATGEILSNAGTAVHFTNIAQGTGESERMGRSIVIKKISIKMYIATSSTQGPDLYRVALVLDKQCNGAAANITDIWESNSLISFNNLANSKRFVILKNWDIQIGHTNVTTNFDSNTRFYQTGYKWMKYHKDCDIRIDYDSTTGAISEVKSNNLFMIGISAADDQTNYAATVRIRYADV